MAIGVSVSYSAEVGDPILGHGNSRCKDDELLETGSLIGVRREDVRVETLRPERGKLNSVWVHVPPFLRRNLRKRGVFGWNGHLLLGRRCLQCFRCLTVGYTRATAGTRRTGPSFVSTMIKKDIEPSDANRAA